MTEVIEAVAVPVESDVTRLGAFEKWLAACGDRVSATAAKYEPAPIENDTDLKAARKQRGDVRRERNAIDAERKQKLAAVEDALRELKAQVKDVLLPLDALDAQFRSLMDDYERRCTEQRKAALVEEYEQFEIADLIPWDRFAHKFDPDCTWLQVQHDGSRKGMPDETAHALMRDAMRRTADDWATIGAFQATEPDRADMRADYLETLDLAGAVKSLQARLAQREAAAQWEREQVELARRAAEAHVEASETSDGVLGVDPVPTPSPAVIAAQSVAQTFQPVPAPLPERREPKTPTHVVAIKCGEREAALIDAYAKNEIHVASSTVARIPAGTRPTIQFRKES